MDGNSNWSQMSTLSSSINPENNSSIIACKLLQSNTSLYVVAVYIDLDGGGLNERSVALDRRTKHLALALTRFSCVESICNNIIFLISS